MPLFADTVGETVQQVVGLLAGAEIRTDTDTDTDTDTGSFPGPGNLLTSPEFPEMVADAVNYQLLYQSSIDSSSSISTSHNHSQTHGRRSGRHDDCVFAREVRPYYSVLHLCCAQFLRVQYELHVEGGIESSFDITSYQSTLSSGAQKSANSSNKKIEPVPLGLHRVGWPNTAV